VEGQERNVRNQKRVGGGQEVLIRWVGITLKQKRNGLSYWSESPARKERRKETMGEFQRKINYLKEKGERGGKVPRRAEWEVGGLDKAREERGLASKGTSS